MDTTEKPITYWVKNPVRIIAPNDSKCCGAPAFVMRVSGGGFVKKFCSKCQSGDTLPESEFRSLDLWVSCPVCNLRMTTAIVGSGNYGFQCQKCSKMTGFGDLLPFHSDASA